MTRLSKQQAAALVRMLETEELSKREVAARFGVSEQRVGQICKEFGVITPAEQRRQAAVQDLSETDDSLAEIAARHGLSYFSVQGLALRKWGGAGAVCAKCGEPARHGLCRECRTHEKSKLAGWLDKERATREGGLLELFCSHDYEGSVAATGFVACLDYLPVYESAGLTIFSSEPGDYVLMHHSAKRALEWAQGQRASTVYLHSPGVLYRELNRLASPSDPFLWLETYQLCRRLGVQVVQAGTLHPQRQIAKRVGELLAEHTTPPMEPEAESLARLLKDRYPGELLRQVAKLL